MRKAPNEDDRRWIGSLGVERTTRNLDRERDAKDSGWPGGRLNRGQVPLGERDDCIEVPARRTLVAPPGGDFDPAGEAAGSPRRLEHVLGPGGRRVVVDKDSRHVPLRRGVNVLRHGLQVDLDDVRPPLVEHSWRGALRASALRQSVAQGAGREASRGPRRRAARRRPVTQSTPRRPRRSDARSQDRRLVRAVGEDTAGQPRSDQRAEEGAAPAPSAVPGIEPGRKRRADEHASPLVRGNGPLRAQVHTGAVPPEISVIIASHNTRDYLDRCLSEIVDQDEVIVVDSASTDGSLDLVRTSFPQVRLVELDRNPRYGAALNVGIAEASGRFLLLMNADAWPRPHAIERLVEFAEREPQVGIVGPRLVNLDGTLQPSVRGFPGLWRLATEYLFLRWLAPWSRALNAFYGSRFDHRSRRDAEFLVGAVLLVRRQLLDEIGPFDTRFFMFNEEVDLCYRAKQRGGGWSSGRAPSSSTPAVHPLRRRGPRCTVSSRSHLRFLASTTVCARPTALESSLASRCASEPSSSRSLADSIAEGSLWTPRAGCDREMRIRSCGPATCRRVPPSPIVSEGCGPA